MYLVKILLLSIAFFFVFSCGKKKSPLNPGKSTYWETKAWDYYDDDADGVSNADEIKAGTHPELITAPNMHNFALSNVFFYLKPGDTKLNSRPLTFEVQNFDANKYLFNILSPMSTSGALPFESYEFRKEHFTLLTQSTFHKPYTRLMYPKIDNSYLNLLNTFFYNREVDTNRFTDAKNIFVSFSLNFSSKLNAGTWSKISGEITWGNNTIPWTWTKNETSQLHWQTEINITDWIATMNRSVPLELKILEWHVETPYGVKIFNQEYLDTLTPFYVLSSSDVIAGWHNPRYPLPAEAITQRPTNSVTSAPWYFFKIENTDRSQTSFWLKEQIEDEIEWIKNPVPLKFEISRTPKDQKYLPLPLNPSIRSLKIHFKTQKYIYPRYVNHVRISVKTGRYTHCISAYPEFNPKNPFETTSSINLKRVLNSFIINSTPLSELIKTDFYLSFEYDNKEITSLTLHWDKNFEWRDFSILGLEHETFYIEFDPARGPMCRSIKESPHRHWPQYKSEQLYFEWQF